jgi:hypothetical protein
MKGEKVVLELLLPIELRQLGAQVVHWLKVWGTSRRDAA